MTWLLRIIECPNSTHIDGTHVPVEEPSTASIAASRTARRSAAQRLSFPLRADQWCATNGFCITELDAGGSVMGVPPAPFEVVLEIRRRVLAEQGQRFDRRPAAHGQRTASLLARPERRADATVPTARDVASEYFPNPAGPCRVALGKTNRNSLRGCGRRKSKA
jgi:hypothetical protein